MKLWIALIIFALISAPVFAIGNVTVTGSNMAPVYVNTRTSYNFLNLSFNATATDVNVTSLNITIKGVGVENVTLVQLINETGSVIASNATWNTTVNYTILSPVGGLNATLGFNRSVTVVINISRSAARTSNITLNLSVGLTTNNSLDNVSYLSSQSIGAQIQDIHVNTTITPRFVDTNVVNQTFVYSFLHDGLDRIRDLNITLPTGFGTPYLLNIEDSSTGNLSSASGDFTNTTSARTLNISLSSQRAASAMRVYFNASTNTSTIVSVAINSTVSGSNFTAISTEVNELTNNITMKQLVNVSSVALVKSTAIINGTDYWEFNFTLNFTENVTGRLQFNMTNWTSAVGNISLVNPAGNAYYVSLRDNGNWTSTMNITNMYNNSISIQGCCTSGTLYYVLMRMVIPTGTVVSNSWSTTYNFLFRST